MAKASRPSKKRRAGRGASSANLSREIVVSTAIDILDREGLDSFGIRSIAKALGVFPTAIYWHVPSRHALIAEVITVILADLVPPRDLPWEEWIKALFVRYRERIRKHPNAAPLIGAQLVSNASVDAALIEGTLAKLCEAGFSGEALVAAYNAVIGGMVGFVTQEFALVSSDKDGSLRDPILRSIATIDASRHPSLAANAAQLVNRAYLLRWENGVSAALDGGFELYADALIAGLAATARRRN
jgi:TetR/AcrR family tetracycline transcriptional repressor